jgi:hypothetical protein
MWRMRINRELRKSYKTPALVADVKRRKLGSLEHVIRMNPKRGVKNIF